MHKLGSLIRGAREARGMTQAELANLIDKQTSYVSRTETGAKREMPTPEDLQAFSRALGVPVIAMMEAAGYPVGDRGDNRIPDEVLAILHDLTWDGVAINVIKQAARNARELQAYLSSHPYQQKSGGNVEPIRSDVPPDADY